MSDTHDIKRAVAADAMGFAQWLYPAGKREGNSWRVGDSSGSPGKSLAIDLTGEFAGCYRDWASDDHGDCISLVMAARGIAFVDAVRLLRERYHLQAPARSGGARTQKSAAPASGNQRQSGEAQGNVAWGIDLPADATPGTESEWSALAALRSLALRSVYAARHLGVLWFGSVCGFPCWILTDARRLIAEARRMDGKSFPAIPGSLSDRKAHTLKGSKKSWPVGLLVEDQFQPASSATLLVVEGGPDYLAALHFAMEADPDLQLFHPVSFLGVGAGNDIHAEALALLKERRARFFPHHESSGAGRKAVSRWAAQFNAIGVTSDAFDFGGLRKADGSAVKDLNDCTMIHAEDVAQLEGLLP